MELERDSSNPWKTLSSEEKYSNPWISVKEDKIIHPNGKDGIYGTVHFKNIAIAILPIDSNGYTWLVGQYRYPLSLYSWEIPEGGCPKGTDPLQSARRELREETGIQASRWEKILTLHLSNSVSDELAYSYLATQLEFGPSEPEGSEQLRIKKLKFETVYDLAVRGEITDALAVATIFRAKLMFAQS